MVMFIRLVAIFYVESVGISRHSWGARLSHGLAASKRSLLEAAAIRLLAGLGSERGSRDSRDDVNPLAIISRRCAPE